MVVPWVKVGMKIKPQHSKIGVCLHHRILVIHDRVHSKKIQSGIFRVKHRYPISIQAVYKELHCGLYGIHYVQKRVSDIGN